MTSVPAKVLIVLLLVIIVVSLGMGLYYLFKDRGTTDRTLKALIWRVVLSVTVFAMLFIAFALGWIKPHGIS